VALDEKDDQKLIEMLLETKKYIYSKRNIIKEVARLLKKEQQ
jgi:hypothetical protein